MCGSRVVNSKFTGVLWMPPVLTCYVSSTTGVTSPDGASPTSFDEPPPHAARKAAPAAAVPVASRARRRPTRVIANLDQ